MALSDLVSAARGVGPKKAQVFEKLHIHTLSDALETYPRTYEDRTHITPIAEIDGEEVYCVRAVVGTAPQLRRIRKGLELTKLTVFDSSGTLNITYFNNKYAAALLREGREYLFYGRVQGFGRGRTMLTPKSEPVAETGQAAGRIVPVYPLCAGLTQNDLLRVTDCALAAVPGTWDDPLPEGLRLKYGLLGVTDALSAIHRPRTLGEVAQARRRMVFEELFLLCCGLAQLRQRRRQEDGLPFADCELDAFFAALPFSPTGAQRRACAELAADCASGQPMNRLVQGDVGSGKTVVAAALCVLAAQNGYQAAFMAPTEILAAQHAATLAPLLQKCGITVALLTGSMRAQARRDALAAIESGEAQVVVGTHALIQQGVAFQRLGAVVADEQHRFGVAQRAALAAKGAAPHTLVMSATPIPRTLALIMYGDLDVSVLDELPPGRTPVQTYAVGEHMRARIVRFIEKQLAAGGQAFVVCPLVEEGELPLKSAEQHAQALQKALPSRRVATLHGRMKSAEKERVMTAFAAGEYDVLVATTVIEVGVDVPNANLMVVEDADRFGLSQLHQLRGRVGRGKRQSYCVFFGADKGEVARERLKTLCQTSDGFEVARADLAMRGPGDFFGRRQHGLPALHVADLAADLALMQSAREEAETLLAADPQMDGYPTLRARVARMFAGGEDAFN